MDRKRFNNKTKDPFKRSRSRDRRDRDRDRPRDNNRDRSRDNNKKTFKKYEKIGKSLNLKFEVPKYVKVLNDYPSGEDSIIKNIPYILLGISSLALHNRRILDPLAKYYFEEAQKNKDSPIMSKILMTISAYCEALYKSWTTDTYQAFITSITLADIIFNELPKIFVNFKHISKANYITLGRSLADRGEELKNIWNKPEINFKEKESKANIKMDVKNLKADIAKLKETLKNPN